MKLLNHYLPKKLRFEPNCKEEAPVSVSVCLSGEVGEGCLGRRGPVPLSLSLLSSPPPSIPRVTQQVSGVINHSAAGRSHL